MTKLLLGKPVAEKVLAEVLRDVESWNRKGVTPTLAVVLVGDDAASQVYVASKEKKAREMGLGTREYRLPEATREKELLELVEKLNGDSHVHGILVQFPLPKQISERNVRLAVRPEKDVDGLHPLNEGKLMEGDETLAPCTPRGVIRLLEEYGIEIEGLHAVVVGRSALVGKPLAHLLLNRNATVTLCHSRTKNLKAIAKQADLLCVAVGKPGFITADMVKKGAVVIDIGITRVPLGRTSAGRGKDAAYQLVGDVDFQNASRKASAITPVPGGVGPLTIAMLMRNTVNACALQQVGKTSR